MVRPMEHLLLPRGSSTWPLMEQDPPRGSPCSAMQCAAMPAQRSPLPATAAAAINEVLQQAQPAVLGGWLCWASQCSCSGHVS